MSKRSQKYKKKTQKSKSTFLTFLGSAALVGGAGWRCRSFFFFF
jgi:hypothetical protein